MAFGIGGDERSIPAMKSPRSARDDRAEDLGMHRLIHAGRSVGGPENIRVLIENPKVKRYLPDERSQQSTIRR